MRVSNKRTSASLFHAPVLAMMITALLAIPTQDVAAAKVPTISAKAGQDKKLQKLVVSGKTTWLNPKSQISIYDAADHRLIFSGQTDSKSLFKFIIPQDSIPCQLQIDSGDTQTLIAVTGADKSCKAKPSCTINGGDRNVSTGSVQSFQAIAKKIPPNMGLAFEWDFGDGSPVTALSTATHTYSQHGLYRVNLTGANAKGEQCSDAIRYRLPHQPAPTPINR